MERRKLTDDELRARLPAASGWQLLDGKLHRELRFDDFISAFSFMTAMALYSQTHDHHPSWHNVYNRVVIDLWTHDAGGITDFDLAWATAANVALRGQAH